MQICVVHQTNEPLLFDTGIASEDVPQTAQIILFASIVCLIVYHNAPALLSVFTRLPLPRNCRLLIPAVVVAPLDLQLSHSFKTLFASLQFVVSTEFIGCVLSARQYGTFIHEQSCFVTHKQPECDGCSLTGDCGMVTTHSAPCVTKFCKY